MAFLLPSLLFPFLLQLLLQLLRLLLLTHTHSLINI